jgi:ArsR family transcriptional regulator
MVSFAEDADASEHLASILKALANASRLRIVATLCDGPSSVGRLAEALGADPAIVSQQLRILRMQGLVEARKSEGFSYYSLAMPELRGLVACLAKCPSIPAKRR